MVAAASLFMLLGNAATTNAGGWAVASLDGVPAMESGHEVTVGFTILQHGVTPVDLLDGSSNEVGIEIRNTSGFAKFYPAVSDGAVGHYLVTIKAPASGTYEWSVRMGWFEPQVLGTLQVGHDSAATSGDWWPTARLMTLSLSVVLAAVAIADLFASRRRRRLAVS